MRAVYQSISRFLRDAEGGTVVEYALIAAMFAIGVLSTGLAIRGELVTFFTKVNDGFVATLK